MSERNLKYDDLPKLQKKIVLYLAKNGALTMSETNRKLRGENTSTTRAFHQLESKEMIRKTDVMEYRGREFSQYWLSMRGVAFALMNKANPETLKKRSLTYFKADEDKKGIEVYFELHSLSSRIANILDRFVLCHGKLEPTELFNQLLPEMVSLDKTELYKLFYKAKEFPDYWKNTVESLTKFIDAIKSLKGE